MGLLSAFTRKSSAELPRVARRDMPGVIALRERSAQSARDAYVSGDIEIALRNRQIGADRENAWVEHLTK